MSTFLENETFITTLIKRLSAMIEADDKAAQVNRIDIYKLKEKDIEKEGCLRAALYQVFQGK